MHYLNRKSILEDSITYSLEKEGIAIASESGKTKGLIPYHEIGHLHLSFAPSRVQTNRFLADIKTTASSIRLVNERFLGPMNFEDQSTGYRAWILELQRKLIAHRVPTTCTGGASSLAWWTNLGCMSIGLLFALVAAIFLFAALHLIIVLKIALICFYLPKAIKWFKRNKPAQFPLGYAPSHLLPTGPAEENLPPPIPNSESSTTKSDGNQRAGN